MTTIYHPEHSHYAVHKAYIQGCFANPDKPPIVQIKTDIWYDTEPAWNIAFEYRIKPLIVTKKVTYPEPMREEPEFNARIWAVMTHHEAPIAYDWLGFMWQKQNLKNGMCFATELDAQACYDALFGEQK